MTIGNETDLSHHSIKGGGMLDDAEDDDDDEDDKGSDIERSDSSFADRIDNIIHYDDIDQNLKGDNINFIGQIVGLSKEKQKHLKNLNYKDFDEDEDTNKQAKPNKFFAAQEKERI